MLQQEHSIKSGGFVRDEMGLGLQDNGGEWEERTKVGGLSFHRLLA